MIFNCALHITLEEELPNHYNYNYNFKSHYFS